MSFSGVNNKDKKQQGGNCRGKCVYLLMLIKQKNAKAWQSLNDEFKSMKDADTFEFYEHLVETYQCLQSGSALPIRAQKVELTPTAPIVNTDKPAEKAVKVEKKPAKKEAKKEDKKEDKKAAKKVAKKTAKKTAKKAAKKTAKKVAKKAAKKVAKKAAKKTAKKAAKKTAKKAAKKTAKKVAKKTAKKKAKSSSGRASSYKKAA